jgi:hypothetical protein
VQAVGSYDPQWFPVEDYDLWFRLLACGRFVGLNETQLTYEVRPDSISAQHADHQRELQLLRSQQELVGVLGEACDRDAVRAIAADGGSSIATDLAALRLLRRYVDLVAANLAERGVSTVGIAQQERMQMLRVLSKRNRAFRRVVVDSMLRLTPRSDAGARRR